MQPLLIFPGFVLLHSFVFHPCVADSTFQNIPRLTDKFLGECGSRRLARRAEIDEHDPNPGEEVDYKRWGEDVFNALQKLPSYSAAPACDWSLPQAKVDASGLLADDDDTGPSGPFHPLYLASYAIIGAMFAVRAYYA